MPEKKNQNKDVASNEKKQQSGSNPSNQSSQNNQGSQSGRSENDHNKQSGLPESAQWQSTGMGDETDIENQRGGSMQNQQGEVRRIVMQEAVHGWVTLLLKTAKTKKILPSKAIR